MSLLIKGADLLGAGRQDLLIRDGLVAEIGVISAVDGETIDADGLVALPGLVDIHTHLREPGREAAETIAVWSTCSRSGRSPRDWPVRSWPSSG